MHALAVKRLLVDLFVEEHARAPKQIILYLCDTAATIFSGTRGWTRRPKSHLGAVVAPRGRPPVVQPSGMTRPDAREGRWTILLLLLFGNAL